MRHLLSATGAFLIVVSLGIAADPAVAKSKREMAALQQAKISLSDAIAIAQKEIPGGKVVDADVSTTDGKVTYAIEILKDGVHAVRVDLQDGKVIEVTQKRVPPKDVKQLEALQQAKVTLLEAISIAQKELPGGRPASADTKTRKGQVIYVVDMEKDGLHVVHVHPESGRVLMVAPKLDD
jgi:uncharacterized membrane protein YkoI